ncbi:YceD family protein [Trichothermofontia sp.]
MNPIPIPQIARSPDHSVRWTVKEFLANLPTLTPVQGWVQVTHCQTYLEVATQAEAIVTLTCDRCLQQYNYRLVANTSELIWLDEAVDLAANTLPAELEVAPEDLVESLSPHGTFDPVNWLYEQMCLALPLRQLCDTTCPGIVLEGEPVPTVHPAIDRRWAALESLKNQLSS